MGVYIKAAKTHDEWLKDARKLIDRLRNDAYTNGDIDSHDYSGKHVCRRVLDRSNAAEDALLAHLRAHPAAEISMWCKAHGCHVLSIRDRELENRHE